MSVNNYTTSKFINVEENCFAYTATNVGDTIVDINGMVLFPSLTPATVLGDSISVSAPKGQLFKGQLKVSFRVALGAIPNVEISQLFYLKQEQF